MVPFLCMSVILDLVNVCICLVYLIIEIYLKNIDIFAIVVLLVAVAGVISGFFKFFKYSRILIGVMILLKAALLVVLLIENPLAPHCPAWVKGITTLFFGQLTLYSFGMSVAHIVQLLINRDLTAEDNTGLVDDLELENVTTQHRLDEMDEDYVFVQYTTNQDGQKILSTVEQTDNGSRVNKSYLVDETQVESGWVFILKGRLYFGDVCD